MTKEKKPNLTLISKTDTSPETRMRMAEKENIMRQKAEYHTNPMYEKLLNFREKQKKKRFTVEDLLKW